MVLGSIPIANVDNHNEVLLTPAGTVPLQEYRLGIARRSWSVLHTDGESSSSALAPVCPASSPPLRRVRVKGRALLSLENSYVTLGDVGVFKLTLHP
jgi:hypothetical protein